MRYNGENTMLLPSADPVVTELTCETCNGSGRIEDYENSVENAGLVLAEIITCPDCRGDGYVEVWR